MNLKQQKLMSEHHEGEHDELTRSISVSGAQSKNILQVAQVAPDAC